MTFYFTADDLIRLDAEIGALSDRVREIGQDMGASCTEGAETYHDNFAFEEGERQQRMWAHRIGKLRAIRRAARLVKPVEQTDKVTMGRTVTFVDTETGRERTLTIGSYLIFDTGRVSYQAPIARALIGASRGDVRMLEHAGHCREIEVLQIA